MLTGKHWQQGLYSVDVVRQIEGTRDRVGIEACQQQEEDFADGLMPPNWFELRSVAADETNEVSFAEFYNEFSHLGYGHIRQTQVHAQRWREGKVYEESIYIIHHAIEAVSGY